MDSKQTLKTGTLFILFVLSAVLITSCSALSTGTSHPSLEERANLLTKILSTNDVVNNYEFMSPEYRDTHSIEQYRTLKRPVYSNVTLHSIDYQDDKNAIVYYTADLKIMGLTVNQTRIYFPFQLTDEGWYLIFKKPFE